MVRVINIESKLAFLRANLKKLERYRPLGIEQIVADQDLIGAVERYLYLAAQSAVDAAEMLCKLKGFGRPASMTDSIRLLRDNGVIAPPLEEQLIKMVGFRNILAHGYEMVDYQIIAEILKQRLDDLETLAARIEENLSPS